VGEVHDLIPLLTKLHFHSPNLRSQTSPVSSSATSTDRLAKATAAAKIARIEAALRLDRRSEASLASQGGGTVEKEGGVMVEKEGGEDGDGEKHEGDRKSVD
jgi:hypothetical protein